MPAPIDITNKRFGKLTAISLDPERSPLGARRWRCLCDCGNEIVTTYGHLSSGKATSCGCSRLKNDLAGRKFGKWTVLRRAPTTGSNIMWRCICECGNSQTITSGSLLTGMSKSCGKCRSTISYEPEYHRWKAMIQRCTTPHNPAYPRYGGRGIYVCERWMTFENFVADMGTKPPGTELDRINNDGPYSPENCRWATRRVNSNNRRNNRFITIRGVTKTLAEWSRETGVERRTIATRLDRGWPPADAVKPV